MRGALFAPEYRPQFAGHETFPLRYGWLKKVFDAVRKTQGTQNRHVFGDEAIAQFGVGKNMVAAMRHWTSATSVIKENPEGYEVTPFGEFLFGKNGVDPYLENHASLWLLHLALAGTPVKTTWFWVFNHFSAQSFERHHLVEALVKLGKEKEWSRVASTTVKRDVECFLRTYAPKASSGKGAIEDNLESPLVELSLIKTIGRKDGYQLSRGQKTTLPDTVFIKALCEFWANHTSTNTLSFEVIQHEPGSPGRVFLLDEFDLVGRLHHLEELTEGALRWSETAGLKQVMRDRELSPSEIEGSIRASYAEAQYKEAV